MTRDWNEPPPQGGPPPAEALLELKTWKAQVLKQKLLEAGEVLPPELRGPAKPRPALPAPEAKAAPRGCTIRWKGLCKAEFLKQLDAECEIRWPDWLTDV